MASNQGTDGSSGNFVLMAEALETALSGMLRVSYGIEAVENLQSDILRAFNGLLVDFH